MAYTLPPEGALLPPKPTILTNPPAGASVDQILEWQQAYYQDQALRKCIVKRDEYKDSWESWYNYRYLTGNDPTAKDVPLPPAQTWVILNYQEGMFINFDFADNPATQVCPPITFTPIPPPQH